MFQRIKDLWMNNRGLAFLLVGWVLVKWTLGIFFGAWLIRHGLAYLLFIPGLVVLGILLVKRLRKRKSLQKALP